MGKGLGRTTMILKLDENSKIIIIIITVSAMTLCINYYANSSPIRVTSKH